MPLYSYTATKQDGTQNDGKKEAENERALAVALKQEGLFLIKATDKKSKYGLTLKIDIGELLSRIRPVSLEEKMMFTRNLAVMINAGLTLTRALEASIEETSNPKFRFVIGQIMDQVTKGKPLSESLKLFPKIFNELVVNMIEVGETTGKLSLVLKLLGNQMKKDYSLKAKIKSAMMYPVVILVALIGIGSLMMIYVVPTLAATIKELGGDLPWTTKIIIATSDALVQHSLSVGLGALLLCLTAWRMIKSDLGKKTLDPIVLHIPLFGSLIQKFNQARFCRTLSYLIISGIPIVRSLEITSRVLGNTSYRNATIAASQDIQTGKQLNEILRAYPKEFYHMAVTMIKVGEETGQLSEMLTRVALFFEQDISNITKNFSSIIEPLLMIIIGGVVGFFAISMLQPIYSSLNNM